MLDNINEMIVGLAAELESQQKLPIGLRVKVYGDVAKQLRIWKVLKAQQEQINQLTKE